MNHPIHPTAIVDPNAILGPGVEIGPFCVVGPDVVLGEDVKLLSHVVVTGRTTLGQGCAVYPFASIGHVPQDKKYAGESSTLAIGAHTILREYVTVQPGTSGDKMHTHVGEHCLLMAGVHVAHDCHVGDHVVLSNNVTLGGHVTIGDWAILGGMVAVHQFVRIGRHGMIGGTAGVSEDVPPYTLLVPGNKAHVEGLNLVGLKRHGFNAQDITPLRHVYGMLLERQTLTLQERLDDLSDHMIENELVAEFVAFFREKGKRPRPMAMPLGKGA